MVQRIVVVHLRLRLMIHHHHDPFFLPDLRSMQTRTNRVGGVRVLPSPPRSSVLLLPLLVGVVVLVVVRRLLRSVVPTRRLFGPIVHPSYSILPLRIYHDTKGVVLVTMAVMVVRMRIHHGLIRPRPRCITPTRTTIPCQ